MTSDIDILSEMLQDKIFSRSVKSDTGKPIITLTETENNEQYSVTLVDAPEDSLVIKADKFSSQNRFFKNVKSKEVNKRADYIIISAKPDPVILFVELKLRSKSAEIKQQLKGAACVLAFCREVGKQFWEKEDFLDQYDHRYIGITEGNVESQPIGIGSTIHSSPESFLSVPMPNEDVDNDYILFKELAAIRRQ